MKVEMNLPNLPEGWEYTGEYRRAHDGETIMLNTGCLSTYYGALDSSYNYFIVKKKRWRAEKGETYYALTTDFVVFECTDIKSYFDNALYQAGNYFQSEKQAEEASIKIKQLLKELHNNGSK